MFFMWRNCLINTLTFTLAQGRLLYMVTVMFYLPPLNFSVKERNTALWNILEHSRMASAIDLYVGGLRFLPLSRTFWWEGLSHQHLVNQLVKIST